MLRREHFVPSYLHQYQHALYDTAVRAVGEQHFDKHELASCSRKKRMIVYTLITGLLVFLTMLPIHLLQSKVTSAFDHFLWKIPDPGVVSLHDSTGSP